MKNIIFDIGDVLVDFDPKRAMGEYGVAKEKIDNVYKATIGSSWWPEMDRGFIPEETVISYMKKNAPQYSDEIDIFFRDAIPNVITAFDYAPVWMNELKSKGYNIYLLSNYPKRPFELHWKNRFNFKEYVDGKVVSYEINKIKPDPGIYQEILSKYSLNPSECVFIDDRIENIVAARYMGIEGVVFTEYEKAKKELNTILER